MICDLIEYNYVGKGMNPGLLFQDIYLASFKEGSPTKLTVKVWVFWDVRPC
jgi:hypothetical protein